jgi:hypothetical protein
MAISEKEAAQSLRDVAQVQRRTMLAKGYGQASAHLALGGFIWFAGYVATGLTRPETWALIWLPLSIAGAFGSFALSFRTARIVPGDPAARVVPAARTVWMLGASAVFIVATLLLFHPKDVTPALAFPALLMAYVYVLIGAMGAPRFLWIGAGIFAVTAAGLTLMPQVIAFWIAAAGGGGLLLGAVWLRRA